MYCAGCVYCLTLLLGGRFLVDITIPDGYPFEPPRVSSSPCLGLFHTYWWCSGIHTGGAVVSERYSAVAVSDTRSNFFGPRFRDFGVMYWVLNYSATFARMYSF